MNTTIIYFLVGTLFSALVDFMHQASKSNWPSIEEWEQGTLTNMQRLWIITLWPVSIFILIVRILKFFVKKG